MSNKYAGRCGGCGTHVAAGEGFFNGAIWCSQPNTGFAFGFKSDTYACRPYHVRAERERVVAEQHRVEFESSPEYAAQRAEADAKSRARAEREAALNATGLATCDRCGGAGQHEAWAATGRTCYKCEGRGVIELSRGRA